MESTGFTLKLGELSGSNCSDAIGKQSLPSSTEVNPWENVKAITLRSDPKVEI